MTLKRILVSVLILAALGGGVLFALDRTIFAPVPVSTGAPIAPTLAVPADRPNDPGQFAPVAEMIGANTADPVSWPPSIFITMDAFRRASQA